LLLRCVSFAALIIVYTLAAVMDAKAGVVTVKAVAVETVVVVNVVGTGDSYC